MHHVSVIRTLKVLNLYVLKFFLEVGSLARDENMSSRIKSLCFSYLENTWGRKNKEDKHMSDLIATYAGVH